MFWYLVCFGLGVAACIGAQVAYNKYKHLLPARLQF